MLMHKMHMHRGEDAKWQFLVEDLSKILSNEPDASPLNLLEDFLIMTSLGFTSEHP